MFDVGARVVHPMHGAGIIEDIVTERVDGESVEFYVFAMSGLLLKIPVQNSQSIGIRPIVSCEEMEALLQALPKLSSDMTTNWSHRYRENLQKLKSGNLYEVAEVIKGLQQRDTERGLSTGERKLLHSARQILLSEMMLVFGGSLEEEELRLQNALF